MEQIKQKLVTEREACHYLGVSRSFLAQGRMDGDFPNRTPTPPYYKIGRLVRYSLDDLDAWLDKYRKSPTRLYA